MTDAKERALERYAPEALTGCWLWLGPLDLGGYGKLTKSFFGTRFAHRAFLFAHRGLRPAGNQRVLHRCDNRCCVSPDHLFIGTQRDNVLDMFNKHRSWTQVHPEWTLRGSRHGCAKLRECDVLEIRKAASSGESQSAIASRFRVGQTTVSAIVRRKLWAIV